MEVGGAEVVTAGPVGWPGVTIWVTTTSFGLPQAAVTRTEDITAPSTRKRRRVRWVDRIHWASDT